ncbi:acetyl-CoA acetyltransferase [Alloalcanivorax xenomutans]|uniref:acetyl-CoA acetyltransferase n=1 Tax=Alloalcanivorax xenomutans TaxID=1094342 RepID=UPI003D9B85D9
MSSPDPRCLPVLVGVGEITDQPQQLERGLEPLALMEHALRRAEQDSGAALLDQLDSVDIVYQLSWPYPDTEAQLCQRLGRQPQRVELGPMGGESPLRYLHQATLAIARGEYRVAAVVGAESRHTTERAAKQNLDLPWPPRDPAPKVRRGKDILHPLSLKHGILMPPTVYPFYENALPRRYGQTPRAAMEESGRLWARMARIAANNPYTWSERTPSAEEIITPTAENRAVAWPYTKWQVANPMVNQGAALLLTSAAVARKMGIPEERWIHLWGGAAAVEPEDYLQRDQFHRSHAQDTVLETVLRWAGGDVGGFRHLELYSCFPCVPKMARRTLGLDEDFEPSVTGGLSFFGAPMNNYMTHAAAAMVRRLRDSAPGEGLLYGQGEYVTKHHAVVLSNRPPPAPLAEDYSVQAQADARRGPVPPLLERYQGPATLETFTALFNRAGEVDYAVVLALTPAGERVMARVPGTDRATLDTLLDPANSPIGLAGEAMPGEEDLLHFRIATRRTASTKEAI